MMDTTNATIHTAVEEGYFVGVNNLDVQNPYSILSYEYERWSDGYARGVGERR